MRSGGSPQCRHTPRTCKVKTKELKGIATLSRRAGELKPLPATEEASRSVLALTQSPATEDPGTNTEKLRAVAAAAMGNSLGLP